MTFEPRCEQTGITPDGVKGYSRTRQADGKPRLKYYVSNGETDVDTTREAEGLEPEEPTGAIKPTKYPIMSTFRDDGTSAFEVDAPNATDEPGSRPVMRTLTRDAGQAPHAVMAFGAASKEAKEAGTAAHADMALFAGLHQDPEAPSDMLASKMMQLDAPPHLTSGAGRRLSETTTDLTSHADEVMSLYDIQSGQATVAIAGIEPCLAAVVRRFVICSRDVRTPL